MNARLGFAIAAHLDPEVLLIDEVLAVGDYTFQQKCYERLRRFRSDGIPIAFVSHNMQAIASLCERVILLRPGEPAILGSVGDTLEAYARTGRRIADSRGRLHLATLAANGTSVTVQGSLSPGTNVTLTLGIEVTESLRRCLIGFEVIRTDGVVVFNGSPMLDGVEPAFDFVPGMVVQFECRFWANLLRGTYMINVHLVDENRVWRPLVFPQIASFVVHETTRVAGYAELHPQVQDIHGRVGYIGESRG